MASSCLRAKLLAATAFNNAFFCSASSLPCCNMPFNARFCASAGMASMSSTLYSMLTSPLSISKPLGNWAWAWAVNCSAAIWVPACSTTCCPNWFSAGVVCSPTGLLTCEGSKPVKVIGCTSGFTMLFNWVSNACSARTCGTCMAVAPAPISPPPVIPPPIPYTKLNSASRASMALSSIPNM